MRLHRLSTHRQRFKGGVIAEFVEAEEAKAGAGAAETPTFPSAEEPVPASDEGEDDGKMDALDECEQAGVAAKLRLELIKGAQAFLGLRYEVWVALEGAETHRVVDVRDGDMVGPQLFAEEHILVAIIAEPLVEGVGEHQVAPDEEVGGVEVLIGAFPAHLRGVLALGGFLVEVAQVPLEGFRIATDGYAPVDDIGILLGGILTDVVGSHHRHVAVDEEQPVVAGFPGETVPDGGPPRVLGLNEIAAVDPLVDLTVLRHHFLIRGAVVAHEDLIVDAGLLSLLAEVIHQIDAQVIIGGN